MEEVKYTTPSRWRVISNRAYYWGKKIMKPGQIFAASREDIPEEHLKFIAPVDQEPPPQKKEEPKGPLPPSDLGKEYRPLVYRMKQIPKAFQEIRDPETGQVIGEVPLFNIIDSNGKKVNEEPMIREKAREMLEDLK